MTAVRSVALALALALLTQPGLAQEPACPVTDPDQVAREYAPSLRFGPGERYFPTLPFFSAIDGVDNDGDSLRDLRDPDEIAPLLEQDGHQYVAFDRLEEWYQQLTGRGVLGHWRAAVFYRIRCLTADEKRRLYSFLRQDSQAWVRFGLDGVRSYLADETQFISVEYYFYYIRDTGLRLHARQAGHLHDTEKAFVFMPLDPRTRPLLRVWVGAGHTAVTPNNVLVQAGSGLAVKSAVDLLVELGGHSSAPDLPPYGHFRKGYDANWYAGEDGWGTRDIQAASGRGFANDFSDWKFFPRDSAVTVVLHPWTGGPSDTLRSDQYVLLPDSVVREFYTIGLDGAENLDPLRAALARLAPYLEPWRRQARDTTPALDPAELATADSVMRTWRNELRSVAGEEAPPVITRVWPRRQAGALDRSGDEDYVLPPTAILKRYLYRPSTYIGVLGPEVAFSGRWSLMAGFGGGIPLWFGPYAGGTLQLQAGVRRGWDDDFHAAFGVVLDGYYYRRFAHYLGLEVVPQRARAEGRSVSDATARFGFSMRLPVDSRRTRALALVLYRIRIGVRADFTESHLNMARVSPEIGVSLNLLDYARLR